MSDFPPLTNHILAYSYSLAAPSASIISNDASIGVDFYLGQLQQVARQHVWVDPERFAEGLIRKDQVPAFPQIEFELGYRNITH